MPGRRQRPPFERTARGFVVNLERDERDVVVRLLGELRQLLDSDDPQHAPLLRRMFPPAYHLADDAEAEAEYQRLMREDLLASQLAALERAEAVIASNRAIADEAAQGFVQSLNAVRLVLGTLLDVGEQEDLDDIDDDHPMVGEFHLYHYLSYLLEHAVQALAGW